MPAHVEVTLPAAKRHARALATSVLLLVAGALSACGNPTVGACERWQDALLSLSCVPDDYAVGIDCRDYEDYPCDASPYFECLEQSYSCSDEGDFVQPEANACASVQGC